MHTTNALLDDVSLLCEVDIDIGRCYPSSPLLSSRDPNLGTPDLPGWLRTPPPACRLTCISLTAGDDVPHVKNSSYASVKLPRD